MNPKLALLLYKRMTESHMPWNLTSSLAEREGFNYTAVDK